MSSPGFHQANDSPPTERAKENSRWRVPRLALETERPVPGPDRTGPDRSPTHNHPPSAPHRADRQTDRRATHLPPHRVPKQSVPEPATPRHATLALALDPEPCNDDGRTPGRTTLCHVRAFRAHPSPPAHSVRSATHDARATAPAVRARIGSSSLSALHYERVGRGVVEMVD